MHSSAGSRLSTSSDRTNCRPHGAKLAVEIFAVWGGRGGRMVALHKRVTLKQLTASHTMSHTRKEQKVRPTMLCPRWFLLLKKVQRRRFRSLHHRANTNKVFSSDYTNKVFSSDCTNKSSGGVLDPDITAPEWFYRVYTIELASPSTHTSHLRPVSFIPISHVERHLRIAPARSRRMYRGFHSHGRTG